MLSIIYSRNHHADSGHKLVSFSRQLSQMWCPSASIFRASSGASPSRFILAWLLNLVVRQHYIPANALALSLDYLTGRDGADILTDSVRQNVDT